MNPGYFPEAVLARGKNAKFELFDPSTMPLIHHIPPSKIDVPSSKRRPVEDYPHFIAIVVDEFGNTDVRSSISLKKRKTDILGEAIHKVRDALNGPPLSHAGPNHLKRPLQEAEYVTTNVSNDGDPSHCYYMKRPCVNRDVSEVLTLDSDRFSHAFRSDVKTLTKHAKTMMGRKEPPPDKPMLHFRADETTKWRQWFADAFKAIQQTHCRSIAKEWIKAIHPKKQSTHPYNGNVPRHGGAASPERTKPDYWPKDVRHKEPDHIDKQDRVTLLVHIIMSTPIRQVLPEGSNKVFTAKDLREVLEKKQDEGMNSKWRIICTIINTRQMLENYEDGGLDPETPTDVPDYSTESTRSNTAKRNGRPSRKQTLSDKNEDTDAGGTEELMSQDTPDESLTTTFLSEDTAEEVTQTIPSGFPYPPEPPPNANGMIINSSSSATTTANSGGGPNVSQGPDDQFHRVTANLGSFDMTSPTHPQSMNVNQNPGPGNFYGDPASAVGQHFPARHWPDPGSNMIHEFDQGIMPNYSVQMLDKAQFPDDGQLPIQQHMAQTMMSPAKYCFPPHFFPLPEINSCEVDIEPQRGRLREMDHNVGEIQYAFDPPELFYQIPRGI